MITFSSRHRNYEKRTFDVSGNQICRGAIQALRSCLSGFGQQNFALKTYFSEIKYVHINIKNSYGLSYGTAGSASNRDFHVRFDNPHEL